MRHGTTLVELLVVLVILGLMMGAAGLALASLRPPTDDGTRRALELGRMQAIHQGRPVVVTIDSLHAVRVRFLPDGRAIGAGVDPVTGRPRVP